MRRIMGKTDAAGGQCIDAISEPKQPISAHPMSSIKTMTMFGAPAGGRTGNSQCGCDPSRVRPILPEKPG